MFFKAKKFNQAPSLGSRGEDAAVKYLQGNGYKILETNFCNTSGLRLGEIDIIAQEGEEIVFIEVKTRRIASIYSQIPEENINHRKLYKLSKISSFYLKKHGLINSPYRFDAISIMANPQEKSAKLRHLKNIFL